MAAEAGNGIFGEGYFGDVIGFLCAEDAASVTATCRGGRDHAVYESIVNKVFEGIDAAEVARLKGVCQIGAGDSFALQYKKIAAKVKELSTRRFGSNLFKSSVTVEGAVKLRSHLQFLEDDASIEYGYAYRIYHRMSDDQKAAVGSQFEGFNELNVDHLRTGILLAFNLEADDPADTRNRLQILAHIESGPHFNQLLQDEAADFDRVNALYGTIEAAARSEVLAHNPLMMALVATLHSAYLHPILRYDGTEEQFMLLLMTVGMAVDAEQLPSVEDLGALAAWIRNHVPSADAKATCQANLMGAPVAPIGGESVSEHMIQRFTAALGAVG